MYIDLAFINWMVQRKRVLYILKYSTGTQYTTVLHCTTVSVVSTTLRYCTGTVLGRNPTLNHSYAVQLQVHVPVPRYPDWSGSQYWYG